MPILNDIIVLNTVGPRTWFPLLSYVSTKPIKFASCARIFGLSLLLDFTDPSFILKTKKGPLYETIVVFMLHSHLSAASSFSSCAALLFLFFGLEFPLPRPLICQNPTSPICSAFCSSTLHSRWLEPGKDLPPLRSQHQHLNAYSYCSSQLYLLSYLESFIYHRTSSP